MSTEFMSTDAVATAVPPFRVTPDFWAQLPRMPLDQYPGTEGYIADVYSNPDGSAMSAGYFALTHTDAPLDYFYDYDEMKVVISGTFRLENVDTGQVSYAGPMDAIFFPKGSRILFSTEDAALAFYVGHRSVAP
ncbi:cupin domain-containing protein [Pseudoclavibacter terrae]|nr:ethanolamine utilization protein [Pseudoclavibacter terrae]